jgi:hypothetical protein
MSNNSLFGKATSSVKKEKSDSLFGKATSSVKKPKKKKKMTLPPIEDYPMFYGIPYRYYENHHRSPSERKRILDLKGPDKDFKLIKEIETPNFWGIKKFTPDLRNYTLYRTKFNGKRYYWHFEKLHPGQKEYTITEFEKPTHAFDFNLSGRKLKKIIIPDTFKLEIQGINEKLKLTVNDLPKILRSMEFRLLAHFPFNGADFSVLKDLKVFVANGGTINKLPIFPKGIQYIQIWNADLDHPDSGVKEFTFKDHPDLKWFDLRNSVSAKYIAADLKKATKEGKTDARYGYYPNDSDLNIIR